MNLHAYALPVLVAFLFVSAFGMYVMLDPVHSDMGCVSPSEHAVLCSITFAYLKDWRFVVTEIFAEMLVLVALAVTIPRQGILPSRSVVAFASVRLFRRISRRPTLFQELYSRGILNRKEPSLML